MAFAYHFPERIESLMILSTNPGLERGEEKRIAWDEELARILETEGIKPFLERWYKQPLFSLLKLTPAFFNEREAHEPKALAQILRGLSPAKLPSMWEPLREFSFPILFLFGENDSKYRPIATKIGKRVPCRPPPRMRACYPL